ncbi:MAG: ISAs1 family transposase [Elainellaceae cyanobacterium]
MKLIIDSGNDYLVAVKSNQKKLYSQLSAIADHRSEQQPSATTVEQQHGRYERRQVRVFSAAGIDTGQWPGAKAVLCIERQQTRRGKRSIHKAYYLTSVATTAAAQLAAIRGHWSIENQLHWPKDVVLKEDDSYGREPNALLVASVFRSIIINLLRLHEFEALTSALRGLANKVDEVFQLLQ